MNFISTDRSLWKEALASYPSTIESLNKPNLISSDKFYTIELPSLLHNRNPNPYITTPELSQLMQWKLSRGKWRPRLLDFVSSLDEELVKSASQKAFKSLPDVSKAINELTVLKGVGPATASVVLAASAPDVAPFMSDEAMEAALGNTRDYTLKQYLSLVDKLKAKAKECSYIDRKAYPWLFLSKELSLDGDSFTPSDVERALWSSAVQAKLLTSKSDTDPKTTAPKATKKKRKR